MKKETISTTNFTQYRFGLRNNQTVTELRELLNKIPGPAVLVRTDQLTVDFVQLIFHGEQSNRKRK